MGRPPCCDKIGVKKGPWTPEEDIILVSYVQEHGPGNWKSIPTNTGLMRCSKSCRLRWTNYLRPGIRRGNFTEQEEKLIIHLQALLGNRWAAIASYLPERTDNDIKNYWNTHLMKKLKKMPADDEAPKTTNGFSRGQWERRLQTDINMAKQALCEALSMDQYITSPDVEPNNIGSSSCQTQTQSSSSSSVTYASSTENISRLLESWIRKSSKPSASCTVTAMTQAKSESTQHSSPSVANNHHATSPESLESLLGLDSSTPEPSETSVFYEESDRSLQDKVPFSVLEEWLFDDSVTIAMDNLQGLF